MGSTKVGTFGELQLLTVRQRSRPQAVRLSSRQSLTVEASTGAAHGRSASRQAGEGTIAETDTPFSPPPYHPSPHQN